MRKLLLGLAGVALTAATVGCHHTHVCGYCDCDPGIDRCSYYFGYRNGAYHGEPAGFVGAAAAAPTTPAEPIAPPRATAAPTPEK
jgi:hypothetical protein